MKVWIACFALLLAACVGVQTPLPVITETQLPPTSTATPPPPIVITHIIRIAPTIVVTATPEPLLAQECFNAAGSQRDLNYCSSLEVQLAKEELERVISQINFSPDMKSTFDT